MNIFKTLSCIIVLSIFLSGCSAKKPVASDAEQNLIEPLRPYVREVVSGLANVPLERREILDKIAKDIAEFVENDKDACCTFICTHNSRRSHMSQIWAQTAACYYGLEQVRAFSGGTEMTACNCRTVYAMRRAGFSIVKTDEDENPIYLVQFSDSQPPVRAYSKLYNSDGNPKEDFIALMTCSQADKKCPVVEGAAARYAIHYVDPKLCDDTPDEPVAYNERCREIAREMFYIMLQVKDSTVNRQKSIS